MTPDETVDRAFLDRAGALKEQSPANPGEPVPEGVLAALADHGFRGPVARQPR